jgi:ribosomal protein S27E
MENNNSDRKWMTKITCPLCNEVHPVIWPHASFPPPFEMMKFECQKENATVVFSTAVTVWAEMLSSSSRLISDEPMIAERFYG